MPKRIALPDGSIGEFPDNMDDAAIEGVLRKQFAPRQPEPSYDPSEGMNPLEKMAVGAGAAMTRAYEGVKGFVGGDTSQLAEDRKLYEQNHPGGWATTGEVVGDVATSLLPMGAAAKGVQVARALPNALGKLAAARYAAPLADVAANTGYAAATAPEDRGTAAAFGAGGAAAGRAASRALGRLVKPTPEAQSLINQGIRLTPGQAGEGAMGGLARFSEKAIEDVPLLGRGVAKGRQQGLEDWNRMLANEARPLGASPMGQSLTPQQATERLGKQAGDTYKTIFPATERFTPDAEAVQEMVGRINTIKAELPLSQQKELEELVGYLTTQFEKGVRADNWKEYISNEIRGAQRVASRDGKNSLARGLKEIDDYIGTKVAPTIDGFPDERVLSDADAAYRRFKILTKAGQKAGPIKREGGAMYPSEVAMSAAKAGDGHLLKQAIQAQKVLGTAPGGMDQLLNLGRKVGLGATGVMAPVAAVPPAVMAILSSYPAGRRFLMGQTTFAGIQPFLQAHPEILTQVGRALAAQGQGAPR